MVVDSSSLISLAWSGQLALLDVLPITSVVIDSVVDECVTQGIAAGHADAAAIATAIRNAVQIADPAGSDVDEMVVNAGVSIGVVISNDLALGRRAHNLGCRWLRTVDLIVLGRRLDAIDGRRALAAVTALHTAGRLTDELFEHYAQEVR